MERERLKSLASRKVKREELNQPCVECGHEKIVLDYTQQDITRVCKSEPCKHVDAVVVDGL
jgi:hypothetical protein